MKQTLKTGAFLGATLAAATMTVLLPGTATAAAEPCTPVVMIPLRGSGEGAVAQNSGWQGPMLDKVLARAFTTQDMRGTPVLEVGAPEYPAVPVDWTTLTPVAETSLIESAGMGAAAAVAAYDSYPRTAGCKDPEVVFLGYSQGAMAARLAAEALSQRTMFDENGPVAAVHLIGDPFQKPDADGVFGGGSNGQGIARQLDTDVDNYYAIPGIRRISICHNNDPVCDAPSYLWDFGPHLNYFDPGVKFTSGAGTAATEVDEVDFMAKALATSVRQARLAYGMGPSVTPIKSSYGPGDTVTARYTWSEPARAEDRFFSVPMSANLAQCQQGMNVVRTSGNPAPRVTDVLQITVDGTRISDIGQISPFSGGLPSGIPLRPGQTFLDVTIRVDNNALARAAADNFAPASLYGPFGSVEQFDTNHNNRIDGQEVFPAYAHVLNPYCSSDNNFGSWAASMGWYATVGNPDTESVTAEWTDGPDLRFSMLAQGDAPEPNPHPIYAAGQRIIATVAGLKPLSHFTLYMESTPTVLGDFTTDNSGIGTIQFDVPVDATPGDHHFVVRSDDGTENLRQRLTVSPDAQITAPVEVDLAADPNLPNPTDPSPTGSLGSWGS